MDKQEFIIFYLIPLVFHLLFAILFYKKDEKKSTIFWVIVRGFIPFLNFIITVFVCIVMFIYYIGLLEDFITKKIDK